MKITIRNLISELETLASKLGDETPLYENTNEYGGNNGMETWRTTKALRTTKLFKVRENKRGDIILVIER